MTAPLWLTAWGDAPKKKRGQNMPGCARCNAKRDKATSGYCKKCRAAYMRMYRWQLAELEKREKRDEDEF